MEFSDMIHPLVCVCDRPDPSPINMCRKCGRPHKTIFLTMREQYRKARKRYWRAILLHHVAGEISRREGSHSRATREAYLRRDAELRLQRLMPPIDQRRFHEG